MTHWPVRCGIPMGFPNVVGEKIYTLKAMDNPVRDGIHNCEL